MCYKGPHWEKKHGYPTDDQQTVELYHLKSNIGQGHNVAAEHPELVAQLQGLLKYLREGGFSASGYQLR